MVRAAMTPRFSVIIPIYNSAKFLRETIESIRCQSVADWELICVDNGSTDSSPQILKEYREKDARIRVLTLPPVGAGAARNAGLDEARGTYVCFCDSDDLYTPTALEHMYNQAQDTKADLVICRLALFNESGQITPCEHKNMEQISARVNPRAFCPLKELPDMLFEITRPWGPTKLYRREYLNAHRIRFTTHRRAEDLPFSFLGAALASTVSFTDEICYLYRQHSDSLSHSLTKEPHVFMEALNYLFRRVQEEKLPTEARLSFLRAVVAECVYHPALMTRADALTGWEKIRTIYEPQWNILPALAEDTRIRPEYQHYRAALTPAQRIYIDLSHGWGMADETVRSIRNNPAFCADIVLLTKNMPTKDERRLNEFLERHYDVRAEEEPERTADIPGYHITPYLALAAGAKPESWNSVPKGSMKGTLRLFRICGWERLHDGFRWMIGRKCAMRYISTPTERSFYLGRRCLFTQR